jgi:hypothetical protein
MIMSFLRPRSRRAADERDELAALHVAPLPWQLAQQLLRNGYDVVFTAIKHLFAVY